MFGCSSIINFTELLVDITACLSDDNTCEELRLMFNLPSKIKGVGVDSKLELENA
jgi:hypothetical protein